MRLAVSVALGRPAFETELQGFFDAQTHGEKELIFVRNAPSPGEARNEGSRIVCERGDFDVIVWWDDDDYYGPEYLAEIADLYERCPGVTFAGKPSFTRLDTTTCKLSHNAPGAGCIQRTGAPVPLPGGTLSCRVGKVLPFTAHSHGEDTLWCGRMFLAGFDSVALSSAHYIKRQFGPDHKHAWPHYKPKSSSVARAS